MKRRVLTVVAGAAVMVFASALPAMAAVITTSDATELAEAIAGPNVTTTGAQFVTVPPTNTPHAIGDSPLVGFPTDGPTYSILTTGDARFADQPGLFASAANGGAPVRGDSDMDVSVLRIDFVVPSVLNCLHFDFKFLSEEFPSFVGSIFNDAFIAELDTSTWQTVPEPLNPISAPDNFAFDLNGNPVTINTTGVEQLTPENAAGTAYNGATPVLTAGTLVTPGPHSLFLSIFDQGDQIYDSAAFVDNLALSFAPTPADCPEGAFLRAFGLDLEPSNAINAPGDAHTVTATVTDADTGAPVNNGNVIVNVTGANPTTATVTTSAAGQATFTYTGTNTGQDVVTACFDANENGTCDPPEEVLVSALKSWQTAPPQLTLTPPIATNVVGQTHTVTANLTTDGGAPIADGSVLFTVEGTDPTTGTATTNAAGNATFSYSGNGVGTDDITACFDANGDTLCGVDEQTATATKTWVVAGPEVTLTPPTASNPVGTQHTVTATLTGGPDDIPVDNGRIVFTVTGANPTDGEALTAENGQAIFDWAGTTPGTDTVTACFDATFNDQCDPGEQTATATKTWLGTALEVTPAEATNLVGADHTVTATLTQSGNPVPGSTVVFIVTGANPSSPQDTPDTAGRAVGEGTSNASGQVTFTYRGRNAGDDTITVCQDTNENRLCDPGETTVTAAKTWTVLPITGARPGPVIGVAAGLVLLGSALVAAVVVVNRRRHRIILKGHR